MTNEELWGLKTEMIRLFNRNKTDEAIKFAKSHIEDFDLQFCDMFITAFEITKDNVKNLDNKIYEKLLLNAGCYSFRSSFRFAYIQTLRDEIEGGVKKKK